MEWLAVNIGTDRETAEPIAELLSRYAPSGVAIDLGSGGESHPVTVIAYLVVDDTLSDRVRELEEALAHLQHIQPISDPVYERVADQDWMVRWKESLPVLHVGAHLVVKPSWRDYAAAPDETVIEIDPGQAFGSGFHPTTRLCLQALERRIAPGMRVLDLGTGSGILAIAAAKLAAGHVQAVDHNADAVAVARANLRLNGVQETVRLQHDSLEDLDATYDLILANLLAHILVRMAGEGLADRLRPSGIVIAAGILEDQRAEVMTAFQEHYLEIVDVLRADDWVTLVAEVA